MPIVDFINRHMNTNSYNIYKSLYFVFIIFCRLACYLWPLLLTWKLTKHRFYVLLNVLIFILDDIDRISIKFMRGYQSISSYGIIYIDDAFKKDIFQ